MNKIHVMVTVREEKPKEPEYHFCYQCKQFYRHYVQSDYTFMGVSAVRLRSLLSA